MSRKENPDEGKMILINEKEYIPLKRSDCAEILDMTMGMNKKIIKSLDDYIAFKKKKDDESKILRNKLREQQKRLYYYESFVNKYYPKRFEEWKDRFDRYDVVERPIPLEPFGKENIAIENFELDRKKFYEKLQGEARESIIKGFLKDLEKYDKKADKEQEMAMEIEEKIPYEPKKEDKKLDVETYYKDPNTDSSEDVHFKLYDFTIFIQLSRQNVEHRA